MINDKQTVLGKDEKVNFPNLQLTDVPARIDTGARTSTIWVSSQEVRDGVLSVIFFGPGSDFYQKEPRLYTDFETIVVRNSTGEEQVRYMIKLSVIIGGRKIRARFTLADRSTQVYPVLIGRNILRGKFIVDVKKSARFEATNSEKEQTK